LHLWRLGVSIETTAFTPFPGYIMPRNHEDWNKAMSEVRVSVE